MNIDDALDANGNGSTSTNWVRSLVAPLLVGTIAGSVSLFVGARAFQSAGRSTELKVEEQRRESAQQSLVSTKLIEAYNAFSAITPAGSVFALTSEEKRELEFAMRDAILYGDNDVREATDKWFKSNFKSPVEGVLLPLRNQIRSLTGLTRSSQTNSPWIQTYWRNPSSAPDTTLP
jgi:hypothetical protein